MWLTEVLGQLKGEEINFKNGPSNTWIMDPHVKVRCLVFRFK